MENIDDMIGEREGTLWGPTVRRAIKRKRPSFSESYYGFRNFNEILEEASRQGFIEISKDTETGHYGILSVNLPSAASPEHGEAGEKTPEPAAGKK